MSPSVEKPGSGPLPAKGADSEKSSPAVTPVSEESTRSITVLSELDSYIAERMKSQPSTLDEATSRWKVADQRARHRLNLPAYFQRLSADGQKVPGPYVFRWIKKDKRAIDHALNASGWVLVNRSYFPHAPRYLFTANGGVEVGDAILGFMPEQKAKAIREAPAKMSQERLRSQMTQTKPDYVLMSGNPKDDRIYQPDLGRESDETTEGTVPGVLTEGRDF